MAKSDINNLEELLQEKDRLRDVLKKRKAGINHSFEALKEEINPFSSVQKSAGAMLQTNGANPIIKIGINKATEWLLGKVLLKKAGWLPRIVVPYIVKETTSRLVGHKPDKRIATILRNAAKGIRNFNFPELSDQKK